MYSRIIHFTALQKWMNSWHCGCQRLNTITLHSSVRGEVGWSFLPQLCNKQVHTTIASCFCMYRNNQQKDTPFLPKDNFKSFLGFSSRVYPDFVSQKEGGVHLFCGCILFRAIRQLLPLYPQSLSSFSSGSANVQLISHAVVILTEAVNDDAWVKIWISWTGAKTSRETKVLQHWRAEPTAKWTENEAENILFEDTADLWTSKTWGRLAK